MGAGESAAQWVSERGRWEVYVPALPPLGLLHIARANAARFLLAVQEDRRRGMPPGDARDELDRAIAALRADPPALDLVLTGLGDRVVAEQPIPHEERRLWVGGPLGGER